MVANHGIGQHGHDRSGRVERHGDEDHGGQSADGNGQSSIEGNDHKRVKHAGRLGGVGTREVKEQDNLWTARSDTLRIARKIIV